MCEMISSKLGTVETDDEKLPITCPRARFRDGNFDRWDVDQAISVEWKMHHAYALSKSVESQGVEKSTDVGPVVRNGSRSPQRCGARW